MRRILIAIGLLIVVPGFAPAALVEVLPDDYQIWTNAPDDVLQTATAPHPIADRLLLVWTLGDGSGSRELVAGIIDPNIPTGESIFNPVDETTNLVRDPAAAFDAETNQFLVVWSQEEGVSSGAFEIWGRLLQIDGTVVGPSFPITSTGIVDLDPAFDALHPTVASNGSGRFLVAWAADDDAYGRTDGQFEIYYRGLDARTGILGPVVLQTSFAGLGGAALRPQLGYLYSVDSYALIWEADATLDPNLYAPQIYAALVSDDPARAQMESVLVSVAESNAARRNSTSAHNPAVAIDRQNQHVAIVWDWTPGPAPVARQINGVVFDNTFATVSWFTARNLDVEGAGPNCYVRDPKVTHSRIAGRYVIAWRESLDPGACTGQTLMARELDEIIGFDAPPIIIANQGVGGVLPNEFGPPVLEGGSRHNGRVFAGWVADTFVKGQLELFGQGFDTDPATSAPPGFIPVELSLGLAPNPFNPRTSVVLSLPSAGRARIEIYDLRGRLVRQLMDEDLPAGEYRRSWSGLDDQGRKVASGVYLVRLRHPGGERVAKAALVE